MKFATLFAFALPAVLAAPTTNEGLVTRQNDVTDELLFSISLPAFTARRNAKDPATLDWSSDNCSWSPDNPFGFPFEARPGCQRHDFGYRNYKAQNRFTDANKLRIDDNFKADLYYQCSGQSAESACRALAVVYYEAVRAFGRKSVSTTAATSTGDSLAYDEAVAVYEAEVKKAQEIGQLPSQ